MYDKQILVDYYNGKRSLDDPDVQREFVLLKKQAAIHWQELREINKDTRATVEGITEDLIYNAKLTAQTQRKLKKIKFVILAAIAVGVATWWWLTR
jgi:hypothetical protein